MFSPDIEPLVVIKGPTVFQNVFLVKKLSFLEMYLKYLFLVFLVSVLNLLFPFFSQEGHLSIVIMI